MKFKNLLILGFLIVFISGCAQIGDIFRIIRALQKEYNHNAIGINIHNFKYMTVNFVNSPFNELEEEEREVKAREIALFTMGLLKEDSPIEKISIAFTIHKKIFLIVNYTNTVDTYTFDVSQLKKESGQKTI